MKKSYEVLIEKFSMATPALTTLEAAMTWDCLLTRQAAHHKLNGQGLLEFGVEHGSAARILAIHAREGEPVVLVDLGIGDRMARARETIASVRPLEELTLVSHKCSTLDFWNRTDPRTFKTFRWIHVDAGHTGQDVINDLELAELHLSAQGVVVLDDFFNYRYPQITKAAFEYLHTNPGKLCMFAVGHNKAYLCRPSALKFYCTYIHDSLVRDMDVRGISISIAKSSWTGEMTCFGIRPRQGEQTVIGPDWAADRIELFE